MQKTLIILIPIIIILAVVVALVANSNSKNNESDSANEASDVAKNETLDSEAVVPVEETTDEMPTDTETPGVYTSYSEAKLDANKTNIIFFAASWCPSCKELDDDINANLENIPANVNILKADYDDETSLKAKYGVTIQHTLVQVDGSGELINKWNGLYSLTSLEDVLTQL